MKKEDINKIMERLDKIEALLEAECPQQMCCHEWVFQEGTSTLPLWLCKKCGAYKK